MMVEINPKGVAELFFWAAGIIAVTGIIVWFAIKKEKKEKYECCCCSSFLWGMAWEEWESLKKRFFK